MKKLFDEVLHFSIVGVFNTILGYVLIMVFYNVLGWNYWIASAVSYTIGSFFSYFANKKLTFKVEESGWSFAVRFAVNIAVCYFLAYGIAKPLVRTVMSGYSQMIAGKIGMTPTAVEENVAIIFGMGLFIVFNFMGQKFFVFHRKNDEENSKGN